MTDARTSKQEVKRWHQWCAVSHGHSMLPHEDGDYILASEVLPVIERLAREQRWNWDQINRLAKALDMLGQPTDKVIDRAIAALLADASGARQPERPSAWYRFDGDGPPQLAWGAWPPPEPDDTAWLPLYESPEGRPAVETFAGIPVRYQTDGCTCLRMVQAEPPRVTVMQRDPRCPIHAQETK